MAFNFCLDCLEPQNFIPDATGCGLTRRGGIKAVWAIPCNVTPVNPSRWWAILGGQTTAEDMFRIFYKDTNGLIRNTIDDDSLTNTITDLYYKPNLPTTTNLTTFNGIRKLSANIVGGISNSTPNTAQLSGCPEPEVYSVTHTIELDFPKSFTSDNWDTEIFWPNIQKGSGSWTLLIERCDGRAMVIPSGTWSITGVKNTDPTSNKEIRMRGISITYTSDDFFIPEYISPVLDQLI